jgi:c-di-GMP-related signal transduction protein
MLSMFPAMLRVPMEELTPLLPLRAEICEALQGAATRERSLLAWLELNESGDWEGCDQLVEGHGLDQERLVKCYAESVVWAAGALRSAV